MVHKIYNELFSLNNIYSAWYKFRLGKTRKYDVMSFERHLEDNLFRLHEDLRKVKYRHSSYHYFQVYDNKKRDIYKAKVRDRVVHQIIYDYLESIFQPVFISDSYSSRKSKGSHKAIQTFKYFYKLASGDGDKVVYILKCDVKKYFDNINKDILFEIIKEQVSDSSILNIIKDIIFSFSEINGGSSGIPLGNITSQIFANIYLNKLDKYIKNKLKARYYIRYNDDFIIIDSSKKRLNIYLSAVKSFVMTELKLNIPDEKTSIRKVNWGTDFLGYNILPNAVLLRNRTKGRIMSKINEKSFNSYMGLLKHCNSYDLKNKILTKYIEKCNTIYFDDFNSLLW